MQYVVELEEGCWLAEGEGDPCRTLVRGTAWVFRSLAAAKVALKMARRYRPFANAQIADAYEPTEEQA